MDAFWFIKWPLSGLEMTEELSTFDLERTWELVFLHRTNNFDTHRFCFELWLETNYKIFYFLI